MIGPPRFSAEVRGRFPALAEKLNEFEKTLEEYDARFQEHFTPMRRVGGRMFLRDAAHVNMLSAHARARVLLWGVVMAVNAELGAVLFLSARAHLETVGMISYLLRQCQRFLAREISPAVFEEQLDRLFLGRRMVFDDDPPDGIPANVRAINVLDLIESVDYLFEGEAQREFRGEFRNAYKWLSEFCHPNLQARLGEHVFEGREYVFLRMPRLEGDDLDMTLIHLRLSDFVVSACLQDLTEIFRRPWPEDTDTGHHKEGES